jgi:MFS family permease
MAFVSLLCLVLYATIGGILGWASPVSLAVLALCVIMGISFVYYERRTPRPMFDLRLLSNRTFSMGNLSFLFNFMAQFIMVFIMPFYLMNILGFGPAKAGWIMTATPLLILFIAPLSGMLSDRIGTRMLSVAGTAIGALALFLMSSLNGNSEAGDVVWRLALFGFGVAIFQTPNNSSVMGSVSIENLGVASGVLATMRNLGMVMGITTAGLIVYSMAPFAASLIPAEYDNSQIEQFLRALRWAFISGAGLNLAASFTSFMGMKMRKRE